MNNIFLMTVFKTSYKAGNEEPYKIAIKLIKTFDLYLIVIDILIEYKFKINTNKSILFKIFFFLEEDGTYYKYHNL